MGDPEDAEVGYRIMRRWWRQGVASEGAREMMRYAFVDLGVPGVMAVTMAVNEGSRAVMRSLGMAYWQTSHPEFEDPIADAEHGEVVYATTRAQWDVPRGSTTYGTSGPHADVSPANPQNLLSSRGKVPQRVSYVAQSGGV